MPTEQLEQAFDAARAAGVELEPLEDLDDAERIIEVMIATWGEHQLLPAELVRAFQDSGNVPWGAFDGAHMVGYVLGFLGIDRDGMHVHSHMLAVLEDWRSKGVGLALKLAQRAQALDAGIEVVRWTFDPLLSRNAFFNMAKLGASADRYVRDFYGVMTDTMNRGDRSDRLVVRWDLDRDATGPAEPEGTVVLDREGSDDLPQPIRRGAPGEGPAQIRIPRDYLTLRDRDAELAAQWREAVADAFEACLGSGLVVSGFTADSTYVLG